MKVIRQTAAGALLLALLFGGVMQAAQQAKQPTKKSPSKKSQTTPEQKPDPLEALLRQAQVAIEKKEYAAAIEPLQKYLAERPEDANAHFHLGYVYSELARWDEAKTEYGRAIAINPELAQAHLNLGLVLVEKEPAAAAESFRLAAELMPGQARPLFLLGTALERSGKTTEATEQYQAAAGIDASI